MANEAICIEKPTIIKRFTVTDGATIAKGTILKLSDPNTAAASSGADVFAGISIEEKTASDGIIEISAALDGVWDLKDAGAGITCGGIISLNGANLVKQAVEAEMVTGAAFGKCFETAGGGEVVRCKIGSFV